MLATAMSPTPQRPPLPLAIDAEGEPPRGCGWFDSSLDLQQGLRVVEHGGFDGLAADLPLAWLLGV
jgi:hypothetical protein